MKKWFFVLAALSLSCSSKPTRESYCHSLSSEQPISTVNIFENSDEALKRQKGYCEPDYSVADEAFKKAYLAQREKLLKAQCTCEVVVFKQYQTGFAVGQYGKQTAEDWAPLCEGVGMKWAFDKGVKAGEELKAKMKTEPEITQRLGYSTDQIKERCTYTP